MTTEFTNEEFKNVVFKCYCKDANCGWYHVCEAIQDGNTLVTNKVHYINRTWERYQYETVYEGCMSLLRNLNVKPEVELNSDMWVSLADDNELIFDFGETTYGDNAILIETWEQGQELEYLASYKAITNRQAEILDRCNVDRYEFRTQYNKCIDSICYTDSWERCADCGRFVPNDEAIMLDYGFVCDECVEEHGDELIDEAIEKSQENFKEAVAVNFDDDLIEQRGFTYIVDEYNNRRTFGAYSFEDMSEYYLAQDIHSLFYGTVIKLTGVGCFQSYFLVAVPDDVSEIAQAFADGKLTEENIQRFNDDEITESELWATVEDCEENEE